MSVKLGFVAGVVMTAGWLPRALAHALLDDDPVARRFVRQACHLPRRHRVAR